MGACISAPGTAVRIENLKPGELALLPKSMFRGLALVLGIDSSSLKLNSNPKAVIFGGHPETGRKAPFLVNSEASAWGRQVVLRLSDPTWICSVEDVVLHSQGVWDDEALGAIFMAGEETFIYARSPSPGGGAARISLQGQVLDQDVIAVAEYRKWRVGRKVGAPREFETFFSWPDQTAG